MTAIAALTLADGAATPVNHTFSPVTIDSTGVAKWADRSGGISVGYPVVTASTRAPSKGGKTYRVTFKVVLPILEVTSASTGTGIQPAPTKAFDCLFTGEFVLPERSARQNRLDILAYAKAMMAHAVITSAVSDFETVY